MFSAMCVERIAFATFLRFPSTNIVESQKKFILVKIKDKINYEFKRVNVMANYCTNCGTKVDKDDKFCYNCGTKLVDRDNNENKKRSSNKTAPAKPTSSLVKVYGGGIHIYEVPPSKLRVKYRIFKVKFGTTPEQIDKVIENGEYSYKIDIYYFFGDQSLYYRSPEDPNTFSKYYNYNLNPEMKKDKNELRYLYTYAKMNNPLPSIVFNLGEEKTFYLENKIGKELGRK